MAGATDADEAAPRPDARRPGRARARGRGGAAAGAASGSDLLAAGRRALLHTAARSHGGPADRRREPGHLPDAGVRRRLDRHALADRERRRIPLPPGGRDGAGPADQRGTRRAAGANPRRGCAHARGVRRAPAGRADHGAAARRAAAAGLGAPRAGPRGVRARGLGDARRRPDGGAVRRSPRALFVQLRVPRVPRAERAGAKGCNLPRHRRGQAAAGGLLHRRGAAGADAPAAQARAPGRERPLGLPGDRLPSARRSGREGALCPRGAQAGARAARRRPDVALQGVDRRRCRRERPRLPAGQPRGLGEPRRGGRAARDRADRAGYARLHGPLDEHRQSPDSAGDASSRRGDCQAAAAGPAAAGRCASGYPQDGGHRAGLPGGASARGRGSRCGPRGARPPPGHEAVALPRAGLAGCARGQPDDVAVGLVYAVRSAG